MNDSPNPLNELTGAEEWRIKRWQQKADANLDEWGLQDRETLLLAIQEEVGELSQAHLEAEYEDGDSDRLAAELDDLGALLLQLDLRLRVDGDPDA